MGFDGAVDGVHVATGRVAHSASDACDACCGVIGSSRHICCGGCIGGDFGNGCFVSADRGFHHVGQFGLRGDRCAVGVGCGNGGLNSGGIVNRHSRHSSTARGLASHQGIDLRQSGRSLTIRRCEGDGRFGGIGQDLQFGYGVHSGSGFAVDDIAQQSSSGRVHPRHAQSREFVGADSVCCIAIGAVGGGQNFVVRVHNGLHFGHTVGGGAVNGCAVEGAVDLIKVVGIHAGDARLGIHLQSRCGGVGGVALGCIAQGAQRCGEVKSGGGQVARIARGVGAEHGDGVGAVLVDQGVGQRQDENACSHVFGCHGMAVGANRVVRAGEREAQRVARFAARGQLNLELQAVGQLGLVDAIDSFVQGEHGCGNGPCAAVCVLARRQCVECEAQWGTGFAGVACHVCGLGRHSINAIFCDGGGGQGHRCGAAGDVGLDECVVENAHGAIGRSDCNLEFVAHERTCGQRDLGLHAIGQFGGVDAGCGVDVFGQHHGWECNGFVCTVGFLARSTRVHRQARAELGGGAVAVGDADLHRGSAIRPAHHMRLGHREAEHIVGALARLNCGGVGLAIQEQSDWSAHLRVGGA